MYPKDAICPVQFFWVDVDKLWIWVHPHVYRKVYILIQQAMDINSKVEIEDTQDETAISKLN